MVLFLLLEKPPRAHLWSCRAPITMKMIMLMKSYLVNRIKSNVSAVANQPIAHLLVLSILESNFALFCSRSTSSSDSPLIIPSLESFTTFLAD